MLRNLMVSVGKIELTVTPKQQGVNVSIPLVQGGSALIEKIRTDCGCTNDPKWNDKAIRLQYNDRTKLGSATSKSFSKFVYVFMKDGNPYEIPNPNTGEPTVNWNKTYEKVELRITVKNKSILK